MTCGRTSKLRRSGFLLYSVFGSCFNTSIALSTSTEALSKTFHLDTVTEKDGRTQDSTEGRSFSSTNLRDCTSTDEALEACLHNKARVISKKMI